MSPLSLEACLPIVQEAVGYVVRRYRLTGEDAEELRSEVHVRLVERDVLGAFQQRSSLRTFLITTVHNVLMDLRNKAWQKWRPSMEAKRWGPLALLLEQLLVRDGYAFGEACQILRSKHGVTESEEALAALRDRLPRRTRRRNVGDDALAVLPAVDSAEMTVLESEQQCAATRLSAALESALGALAAEDRLILKMHFYDGLKVAEIARLLRLEQRGLYSRLDRLLRQMRTSLVAAGCAQSELADVLGETAAEISPVLAPRGRA